MRSYQKKWSNYFQEEYEKIKRENVDTLGAIIEFLKKRLKELCTQRYVVKGARHGEKIFYDKIDNNPGKWGCKEHKKRKFGRQFVKPVKNLHLNFLEKWKNGNLLE